MGCDRHWFLPTRPGKFGCVPGSLDSEDGFAWTHILPCVNIMCSLFPQLQGGPAGPACSPPLGRVTSPQFPGARRLGCRPEPVMTRPLPAAVTGSGMGSRPSQLPDAERLLPGIPGPRLLVFCRVLQRQRPGAPEALLSQLPSRAGVGQREAGERGYLLGRCPLTVPDFCFSGNMGGVPSPLLSCLQQASS